MKTHKRRRMRRTQRAGMFKWASRMWSRKQLSETLPKDPPPAPTEQMAFLHHQESRTDTMKERKLQQFLRICGSNLQACTLFGHELEQTLIYFDFFMLDGNPDATIPIHKTIQVMSNDSFNGKVARIKFTKNELTAFALLKRPLTDVKDSVWYEYLMGKYINSWCYIFPSFVFTYGLYNNLFLEYPAGREYTFEFKQGEVLQPMDLTQACAPDKRENVCLLTQFLDNATSLGKVLDKNDPTAVYVFYQIYYTLFHLTKLRFQHNDLHPENVLVITLPYPVRIVYQQPSGEPFVIYTDKIGKMIDYGRCKVSMMSNKKVNEKRIKLKQMLDLGIQRYKSGLHSTAPELNDLSSKLMPPMLLNDVLKEVIPENKVLELLEAQEDSNSLTLLSNLCKSATCADNPPIEYTNLVGRLLARTCGNDVGFKAINKAIFGQQLIQHETYGRKLEVDNDNNGIIEDPKFNPHPRPRGIRDWRDGSLSEIMSFLTRKIKRLKTKVPPRLYGTLHVKGPTMEPMVFTKA